MDAEGASYPEDEEATAFKFQFGRLRNSFAPSG
jgi:hypothetical protein